MITLKNGAQVLDNCLPTGLFEKVQSKLLDFKVVPFYFLKRTAYRPDSTSTYDTQGHSFCHNMLEGGEFCSPYSEMLHDSIIVACDKAGRKIDTILGIRLGLITSTKEQYTHEKHVDLDTPHTTGLLYLNTTDGDTAVYSGTYREESGTSIIEQSKAEMSILQKISPKANRVVFINGYSFHSSSTPTKTPYRLVVNFNFTEKRSLS